MCVPLAALAIAGTVMSVAGTGFKAIQASQQANYKAQIEDRNASLEADAANTEQQNTRQAALDHYRQVAQLKGKQVLGAAANGVVTDFGTASDVVSDTDMLGAADANKIYRQGAQNVLGHDIAGWNDRAQASADRSSATGALIGGAFGAAATALGGATQYAKLKAGLLPSAKTITNSDYGANFG